MHLTTNIALYRARFQHKSLRFQIKNPLLNKALSSVLTVAVFAVFAGGYLYLDSDLTAQPAAQEMGKISTSIRIYSVNGLVVSVSPQTIELTVNSVVTQEGQNKIVQEDKSVQLSDATKIQKIAIRNGSIVVTEASITDVTKGRTLAVYTSVNPDSSKMLHADKIEIIER